MRITLLFLGLLFTNIAHASIIDDVLIALRVKDAPVAPECLDQIVAASEGAKISCRVLADSYCKAFWQGNSPGNYEGNGVVVRSGDSEKGAISENLRMDLEALVNSEKKLADSKDPVDRKIAEKLHGPLERLAWLLEIENDSDSWNANLSEVQDWISSGLKEIAKETVENKKIESEVLLKKAKSDELDALIDRVIRAQYEDHPNWKRVQSNFEKAKESLLKEVGRLPYDEGTKARFRSRISKISLSMPYHSKDVFGFSGGGCGPSTTVNAFYSPLTNRFTVCQGLFNSYQSDGFQLFVIGHELSHSVEPDVDARLRTASDEDSIGKIMNELIEKNGNAFSCSDWERRKAEIFQVAAEKNEKALIHPMEKLLSCLSKDTTQQLKTNRDLDSVSAEFWVGMRADLSQKHAFSKFLAKEWAGKDSFIKNPFLDNPRAFAAYLNNVVPAAHNVVESAKAFYILQQEKLCQTKGGKVSAQDFQKIVKNTGAVIQAVEKEKLKHCGKYCDDDPYQKGIGENYADWLSIQAYGDYLRSLPPNQRTFGLFEAGLAWCEDENPTKLDREIMRAEDMFTSEPHAALFRRFESQFNTENAQIVGCTLNPNETKEYGDCEP